MMRLRGDEAIAPDLSHWLDLFRGGAAIAVVLAHAEALLFIAWPADHPAGLLGLAARALHLASRGGTAAVLIFFVLSGYLVGGRYLVRALRGRADPADYIAARLSRLWVVLIPALFLTFALDAITLATAHGQAFIDARPAFFGDRPDLWRQLAPDHFVCNVGFVQTLWCRQYGSNLSLWSISNEGLYYAAWFGLVLGLRRPVALLIPLIVAAMIASGALLANDSGAALRYLVYFLIWAGGALAFAIGPIRQRWALAALGVAALLLIRWHGDTLFTHALIAIAFAAVLKLLEARRTPFPRVAAVAAAADISFSLYATHLPVLVLLLAALGFTAPIRYSWPGIALFALACAVAIGVGGIFWLLFERQTKRVRNRLRTLPAVTRTRLGQG